MAKSAPVRTDLEVVAVERRNLRSLLAVNPNHFGTMPHLKLPVVLEKKADTTYERLTCVSFSPERDRLEATIQLRRSTGYKTGLCGAGSFEHVRFYVSYDDGASWVDAGVASTNVHDVPAGTTCDGAAYPPLSYVVGLAHAPRRSWCGQPVLPLVRAILSWDLVPDPGSPDQQPIWGDVHECHVQVRPRRFLLPDLVAQLPDDLVLKLPPELKHVLDLPVVPELVPIPFPVPDPDPGPLLAPLGLPALAKLYAGKRKAVLVPEHRFVFPHLAAVDDESAPTAMSYVAPESILQQNLDLDLDLGPIIKALEETKGDVSFEELECVGLDNNTDQLVASFRVKRSSGFSGGPCTAGSTEFVAFWGDFEAPDGACEWKYLGTVPVSTHDFAAIPTDGLCYAAPLQVDLGQFRKHCGTPVIGRVRAVLSWGSAPSTTDPDAVPHWGNRLDVTVQVRPGQPYDGTARMIRVGGVASQSIDLSSGRTLSSAFLDNGVPVGAGASFGGTVTVNGATDPALAGQQYRLRVRNLTTGGSASSVMDPFYVINHLGVGSFVTPGAGGWTSWPTWQANSLGKLGHVNLSGDDLWEVVLELQGVGPVDTRRVQLDNTLNPYLAADVDNRADLSLNTAGACRHSRTQPLTGTFVARDDNLLSWGLSMAGGSGGNPLPPPSLSGSVQTPVGGQAFSLNVNGLDACGYVVRLTVTDRVIASSASFPRTAQGPERGVCLE